MKILGLIGGISWVSTVEYYKLINQAISTRLGGLNSAHCIVYSFNFADIKKENNADDLEIIFKMVLEACVHLKNSGAKAVVLCANTMHIIADRLESAIGLPVIHIASATATAIKKSNVKKVGLLGTKFTMDLDFFKSKLTSQGIEIIVPDETDKESTKQQYILIINKLIAKGAEGIVLACTEIPLLIQQADISVPVFDTTYIHATAAVDFSLD